MARKRKKAAGKFISSTTVQQIRRLLNGHRLTHGYEIVKRKRRRGKGNKLTLI